MYKNIYDVDLGKKLSNKLKKIFKKVCRHKNILSIQQ